MKKPCVRMIVRSMALVMLLSLSCSKNEIVDPANINNPSYASIVNAFSYSIDARQFTSELTVPLIFTCDSLSYALSVNGYSYGKASIVIYADSLRYRSTDLTFNTNQAFIFSLMGCQPDSITLTFSRFSGRISFALGGISASLPGRMPAEISHNMLTSLKP